jgi:hypothetical protein
MSSFPLFRRKTPIATVILTQQDAFWPTIVQFPAGRVWKFSLIRVKDAHLLIARRERQDGNTAAYALSTREPTSGDLARLVPFLS